MTYDEQIADAERQVTELDQQIADLDPVVEERTAERLRAAQELEAIMTRHRAELNPALEHDAETKTRLDRALSRRTRLSAERLKFLHKIEVLSNLRREAALMPEEWRT